MARPKKATVDYFPHVTEHGKTMFVLQSKWKNDGYATWFKVLEKLGSSDGHFLDCREETSFTFLAAYCNIPEETLIKILDTLAYLHAIDRDLWRQKVVFSQRFVDGVKDAYRKRLDNFPTREKVYISLKLSEIELPAEETPLNRVSVAGSTEREREREREREIKDKDLPASDDADDTEKWISKKGRKLEGKRLDTFKEFWEAFDYKKDRANAIDSWLDIEGLKPSMVVQIIKAAKIEAHGRGEIKVKGGTPIYAQGWLTARRWEDEVRPAVHHKSDDDFKAELRAKGLSV